MSEEDIEANSTL